MKRTLLILLMLFLGGVLTAQDRTSVFVSSRDVYPGEWGDEVIVRNYKNSHVLVHHHKTGNANNHCFMLKDMATGVVRGVYTNFGHSLDPDEYRVSCHVNDMQILGDTCYFCGQITYSPPPVYDAQGNLIDQSQSYGLLGLFPVTALQSGSIILHFEKVPSTEELYQLVPVRKSTLCNGYDVLVSAVGRMADDGAACVYEASLSGGIWSGSLMYLDASTDAVFTDIINNNGSLIVSSYLKCGGDSGVYATEPNHYVVVLHEATCNGYTTDYVAPFNTTETAMMYDFSTWTGGDGWGWHKSEVPLKLCNLSVGRFCMAFSSVKPNGASGIVSASMQSIYGMDTAMLLMRGTDLELKDMVRMSSNNCLAVLGKAVEYVRGTILIRGWTSSTALIAQNSDEVTLQSLDCWNAANLIMGGYKAGDHKRVSVLRQDVGHLVLTNECINTSFSGTAQLGNAYGDKLDCEWHNKYSQKPPEWSSVELQVLNINVAQDCEYYTFELLNNEQNEDEAE